MPDHVWGTATTLVTVDTQNVFTDPRLSAHQSDIGTVLNQSGSTVNGIVIGLLSSFGSALLIALVALIIYFFKYTRNGRILLDRFGRPGEFDDEQAFAREEAEALEEMDDLQRADFSFLNPFVQANPPDSLPTDISLSQYLAIQEKGVSAWEFEPELEIANCFVEGRTEIEFFDSECSTMTNLPIPKQNEVYYWESKIYDKPDSTLISIGVATKPYPLFRLPGWHKYSVAYLSTGHRRYNQPFNGPSYGPQFVQGDVVGVGYRPRTGTIFFTRNGKRLDDVVHGLKSQNLFPAVGANGPCSVHVNFGQSGFVFIEANVKKWGLAPMTGSLAPPPPYGSDHGSILLETGRERPQSSLGQFHDIRHGRIQNENMRHGLPTSPGPVRSPTDISLTHLTYLNFNDDGRDLNHSAPDQLIGYTTTTTQMNHNQVHQPPPEYTSPHTSETSTSGNSDSGESHISRKSSPMPPVPSYGDAMRENSGTEQDQSYFNQRNRDIDSNNRDQVTPSLSELQP
ncbi:SPRY domain-containing protein [Erysiphe pulchra]|uniref:Protein SSH4 n=1 Tax=Erysiphe pulchra TaxID=225359 RepID=A0A2S4Q1A5_9PEZI|nr:SPRY domain-containing protein [Erysiphe pulchra]